VWVVLLVLFASVFLVAQTKQPRVIRRPAADAAPSTQPKPQDDSGAVYVLDGVPVLLELHHDTEVGTNKPIDVYQFVIEMQVMNSDGNLEPVGLQIFNFYTRWPQDRQNDINPHNARDCGLWAGIVTRELKHHNPKSKTWPYVEFQTAVGARIVQTNEDGAVWYSDDIQCWGAQDRFSPF
jgi:hypothetical protein